MSSLRAALQVLREEYPHAQQAFLEYEVFDQSGSRRLIGAFGKVWDLLAEALEGGKRDSSGRLNRLLERFALAIVSNLCHERLDEIERLGKKWRVFWWVMFLRNPFKSGRTVQALTRAYDALAVGRDTRQPFADRIKSLQEAFGWLEQAITCVEPYRVYDRLFAWLLCIAAAIASGVVCFVSI